MLKFIIIINYILDIVFFIEKSVDFVHKSTLFKNNFIIQESNFTKLFFIFLNQSIGGIKLLFLLFQLLIGRIQ